MIHVTKNVLYRGLNLTFLASGVAFWISATDPGIFSYDSLDSWTQIRTWHFNDLHPVVYTIWLWLTSGFGNYVVLATIIQSVLFVIAIVTTIRFLFPDRQLNFCLFWAAILEWSPFVGQMGVTVWKDVPACYFILFAVSYFGIKENVKRVWISGPILGLGCAFRHEGLAMLVLTVLILAAYMGIKKFSRPSEQFAILRKWIGLVGLGLVFCSFFSLEVPSIAQAAPLTNLERLGPLIHDLSYTTQRNDSGFSPEDKKFVTDLVSGKAASGATNCQEWDGMALSPGINYALVSKSFRRIILLWSKTLFSNSGTTEISAHLCRSSVFLPGYKIPSAGVWTYFEIDRNSLGIKRDAIPYTYRLARFMDTSGTALGRFLGWPGMYLDFLLIIYIIHWFRKSWSKQIVILLTVGLIRALFNIFYTVGPYFRYGMLTEIIAILLLLRTFLDRGTKCRLNVSID
jgi:hypothetical protein